MIDQPFNRRIEVLIGPLAEWRGGGDTTQAIKLVGDGTTDGLRIKFCIHKHVVSTASPTTISVYNLGPGLRNALKTKDAKISIRAGWENTGMVQVFSGSVLAAVNNRQGPDIVTDIMSLAGYSGTARSVTSKVFSGGTKLGDVVVALAQDLVGVSVDKKHIDVKDTKYGGQGWSFAGMVTEGLDKLARVYGFSWWIDQGRFHAVDDGRALRGGSTPLISGVNGFLLRAEPMLASPFQMKTGASIYSIFNPFVEAGRSVKLESSVNPDLNGVYKVHTLQHDGDTHSSQWQTNIQSWIVV